MIRTAFDFRRKDLFEGRAFTANEAEFGRGAETVALEKSKGKDDMDVGNRQEARTSIPQKPTTC